MPFGSLHDHLRGKFETSRALNWGERLRIAHDAAQGLHYLHTGCNIIHRDVKTSNILLGSNLEAKIADFGLSKVSGNNSSPPTFSVVGTLGYIDPESHRTQSLNEKSDVYSFGVVLLELVTGELPVVTRRDRVHIVEHVKGELARGNIDEICDKNMKGEYDTYSVWKVLDLAMRCTAETAAQRPKMAEVASQLDESLQVELTWRSKNFLTESSNSGVSGGVLSLSSMGPSAR
ncbi:Leucine-rich repeat protein kinase family protein [Rhynchospora pubera]|uniref:Leucine-rich repeat protein kinase family protein n=1 Tax=Rhynchospora pubera TaxID=906938 RepID=A0AAV8GMI8_9POAL|nr:Leucine-rich repeat protein kinase family protein [Rhynchospora pubera]